MDGTESQLEILMRACVQAELRAPLAELRQFVDRRIAELSAEIHATVQLLDFSESNLSGQLARIHEQIGQMVAVPASSVRNGGLELEAVVQATEAAADRIMEAAEAIGDWLRHGQDPQAVPAITEKVNAIFEACTFQDLTGQRIRRAIEHLQQVETMLGTLVPAEAVQPAAEPDSAADLAQNDVDALFS